LSEIFHARPADVEEMIQRRLEERNWHEERKVCGLQHSAWVSSYGPELREHLYGRDGGLGRVA